MLGNLTRLEYYHCYIEMPFGCWAWVGPQDKDGYGLVNVGGKLKRVHRLVYESTHGDIPDGLLVCHRCDEPSCINPEHLFLGSPRENVVDSVKKGRSRLGELNGGAKLTWNDIEEIRREFLLGARRKKIARKHKISYSQACQIIRGTFWKLKPVQVS